MVGNKHPSKQFVLFEQICQQYFIFILTPHSKSDVQKLTSMVLDEFNTIYLGEKT